MGRIKRRLYALLFILASLAMLWVQSNAGTLNVAIQITVYGLLLFLACMIAHGELYLLRPSASHLTSFYLMVSVGGALGGIFVNLIAPFIFTGYWEFYLAWLLTIVIVIASLLPRWDKRLTLKAGILLTVFILASLGMTLSLNRYVDALFVRRNFYGILRVREWQSSSGRVEGYAMIHGATVHGIQYLSPERRDQPTTYYVPDGGAGLALLNHPRRGGVARGRAWIGSRHAGKLRPARRRVSFL